MPFRRALREAWRQEATRSRDETQVVDRAVIFVLVIAIGCVILLEMWTLRAYLNPMLVGGKYVESRIDAEIGDMIAARNPSVSVGHARCPVVLDLTGASVSHCSLAVSGAEMSIRVRSDSTRTALISSEDTLIVPRTAERRIAGELENRYGEPFRVRCADAPVQILHNGETFFCKVEAPDVARAPLEVRAAGDSLFTRGVQHVPTRFERVFGRALAEQRSGPVVVAGSSIERYVRGSAAAQAHGEVGRRGLVGPAHCPRVVTLRGLDRVRCTVLVGGRAETYDVRFDEGRGLEIEAQQPVIVLADAREIAERYFERTFDTGGKPLRAVVDCGRETVAFVEPGGLVPCSVKVGKDEANFALHVTDATGTFDFVERD